MLERVDHLVYTVPDLVTGTELIAELGGVVPANGGSHPNWGTANTLLALGPRCYLEVIGPDPEQTDFEGQRAFGITPDIRPHLATWAANGSGLEHLKDLPLPGGEHIGRAFDASRETPEGTTLNWQLTDPTQPVANGLIPFFIDWKDTAHPAENTPPGMQLVKLHLEHPRPAPVREALRLLAIDIPVHAAAVSAVVATLEGPRGTVVLR